MAFYEMLNCSLKTRWPSALVVLLLSVCRHFSSKPAAKLIHSDEVQPRTLGMGGGGEGPPVGEEDEGGLCNPWGYGPPIVSSSISSKPTLPPEAPLTVVPIICLSVVLLLSRHRGDERIYCNTRQEGTQILSDKQGCLVFCQSQTKDATENQKSFLR